MLGNKKTLAWCTNLRHVNRIDLPAFPKMPKITSNTEFCLILIEALR